MASLNIRPDLYNRLQQKAEAQRTSVEALVEPVLDQLAKPENTADEGRKAFDEWMALIQKRANRYPPGFVVDDSRESIYEGRK